MRVALNRAVRAAEVLAVREGMAAAGHITSCQLPTSHAGHQRSCCSTHAVNPRGHMSQATSWVLRPTSCSTPFMGSRQLAGAASSAPLLHQSSPPPPGRCEVMANLASDDQGLLSGQEATCVRVTLRAVPGDTAELLSDALLGSGATSVVVVEHRPPGAPEQEIYEEPGSGAAELWDQCDVVAYYPLEYDPGPSIQESVEVVGLTLEDLGGMAVEPVANAQWVDQIKASYVPLQLSPRLYIVPEWSQPVDPSALNIIMQPGVAFGTGEHPTTRMCLAALEDMGASLQGTHVMDYGTGSGVLALAALLLGAESAAGTDTDPLAVRSAARNAELTGVAQGSFHAFVCGPHSTDPEPLQQAGHPRLVFDVVVANILRGPLIELQPRLTGYCRPGATLLLSGILAEQVLEIRAAYEPYFDHFDVRTEAAWACISARRR